ncbi:MAG: hypothetical protein WCI77_10420 [Candidatus Omnitrophota bacterium]
MKRCLRILKKDNVGAKMVVEKTGEKCGRNVCGNEVTVIKVSGGELVCCGKPMEKIPAFKQIN